MAKQTAYLPTSRTGAKPFFKPLRVDLCRARQRRDMDALRRCSAVSESDKEPLTRVENSIDRYRPRVLILEEIVTAAGSPSSAEAKYLISRN
jgi:hypothetical protein